MQVNLNGRISKLEKLLDPLRGRSLRDLSDEELKAIAGPPDPAFEAWLATLPDEALEELTDLPDHLLPGFFARYGHPDDFKEDLDDG